ncbi:hypothetical protein BG74_02775 [Sodalis-like endosymbiont of Proechinophthirus fluctus]|uniref:YbdD/YjiX family protein n=1 Tax=Sodalis-like endosymbiont of Proechinophthirus fluctus TaxID=1462730 RepID=UPI0007A831EB|nr:CstA-like transporter-associated (seleno)protein [Sodalis-like endosymbiont of Proechinophthirus fluctus]KYP97497.1 hypothetical protein BG74_02775 [Sodalis-like endosymbiont of Proechinophthirus fluctus]
MFENLGQEGEYLAQATRMPVSVQEYDHYVEHMYTQHPDTPTMSYKEFFRERQEAHCGGSGEGGFRYC